MKNFEKEKEREFGKICERKVGAKGNADSTDESDEGLLEAESGFE